MLVETHANLHHDDFAEDLDAVMERALAIGVGAFVTICCDMDEFAPALKIAKAKANTWCTIGVHPHHAAKNTGLSVDDLLSLCKDEKIIGIGETGLDYHYTYSPRDTQIRNFLTHIEAARRADLPLVIHTREADDDMSQILQDEQARGAFRFVLHSYTSGPDLAKLGARLGGYFSVNGICTFKNANSVRDTIKNIMPDDRIMLETDCPYLAPIPHRGRRSEPAFLSEIRDQLMAIKGWDQDQAEAQTTNAFFTLFTKASRP